MFCTLCWSTMSKGKWVHMCYEWPHMKAKHEVCSHSRLQAASHYPPCSLSKNSVSLACLWGLVVINCTNYKGSDLWTVSPWRNSQFCTCCKNMSSNLNHRMENLPKTPKTKQYDCWGVPARELDKHMVNTVKHLQLCSF